MELSGKFFFIFLYVLCQTYFVAAWPDIIDINNTRIVFYYGPTYEDNTSYPLSEAGDVVNHPKFLHNRTTFFIPDYYEPQMAQNYTHYKPMADPYNQLDEINLLILVWGAPDMVEHISELQKPDVENMAPILTEWILDLREHISWKSFHLLTYATGCELGVMIARNIMKSGGDDDLKLARLTALDPPKIMKWNGELIEQITPNDADFVDGIHTDAGNHGSFFRVGHADFWPNGGSKQPGCKPGTCSMKRAWEYWAESVANQDGPQFCAYRAPNYVKFLRTNKTYLEEPVLMGLNCDKNARGNYYLRTNKKSPYAKGCGVTN